MSLFKNVFTNERTIVVMDGTNVTNLNVIISTINLFIHKQGEGISWRVMSEKLISMIVIRFVTDEATYEKIQKTLDEYYPGLCIYDPPM